MELLTAEEDGGARVVNVGKDYSETATYKQAGLLEDLRVLHEDLEKELDMSFVRLICPKGWRMDHTEHACCERRRYDDAVAASGQGKRPHRERDEAGAPSRQAVRSRRLRVCWKALGFKALPSRASE